MTAAITKGSNGFPGQLFKQSEVAGAKTTWLFHLAKSADGADDTAVVPVVTIAKAGAAFGAAAGVVTELSLGWYKVAFTAADLDTLGALAIHVAVATADSINEVVQVVAFDPYDAVRQGMTALPAVALNASGGLAAQVAFGGTASAGAASTITLAGASAVDQFYKGATLLIVSGTGAGQTNRITGYVGATKVATVAEVWGTNPDNTSVYVVLAGPRGLSLAADLAAVASDVSAIDAGALPTHRTSHVLGPVTTAARTSTKLSIAHAVTASIVLAGTWGGGSVQVKTSEDGVTFTNYGAAQTGDATVDITEPHFAVEAVLTGGDVTTTVAVTLNILSNG